jgi:hypothetical protein
MDKYELRNIKNINIAKRVSYIIKEEEFDGFFIDDEILRAS